MCCDLDIKPFDLSYTGSFMNDYGSCADVVPSFQTMIVHTDGTCYIRNECIGVTDPRRLDEYGSREIYKDGEVVASFFNEEPNPVGYALAE